MDIFHIPFSNLYQVHDDNMHHIFANHPYNSKFRKFHTHVQLPLVILLIKEKHNNRYCRRMLRHKRIHSQHIILTHGKPFKYLGQKQRRQRICLFRLIRIRQCFIHN
jgi:hypothetical protein